MAAVEFQALTKRFGDVTAVRDLSLDVDDGEFLTFVGPSGCGKTTSLRMLAGFESPTEGSIRIEGEDVTHTKPYERDVGMVFQSFALFPHMSVGENIAYGLHESTDRSQAEIDATVEDLLETIRLPGVADRDPAELSGGQQQRVALARALAIEPDVLLLDEPLASLDKKLREQMQVELRRIHNELGITTVFVTHNQREAMSLSDRIAVMDDGEVVQVGSPETVYRDPASPFVADFIGTSNVFEAEVRRVDDEGVVVTVAGADLAARTAASVAVGDEVTVTFRPGAVDISDRGDGLRGAVDVKRYFGEHVEYHVDVGGATVIAHQNVAESDGRDEFETGDSVVLTVPPEALTVFD